MFTAGALLQNNKTQNMYKHVLNYSEHVYSEHV